MKNPKPPKVGEEHDLVRFVLKPDGPVWVCLHCDKQFEGKPQTDKQVQALTHYARGLRKNVLKPTRLKSGKAHNDKGKNA